MVYFPGRRDAVCSLPVSEGGFDSRLPHYNFIAPARGAVGHLGEAQEHPGTHSWVEQVRHLPRPPPMPRALVSLLMAAGKTARRVVPGGYMAM